MNVVVTLNDGDITNYVVNISTNQQVCTGIGTMELALSGNFPLELLTWDIIKLYEDGDLIGTYNISQISYDSPEYLINIQAQDDSKKLQDYFIADDYTVDDASTNQYWIEKFLEEATVSYYIPEDLTPVMVSNNTYMGKCTAYEQMVQLLQMSGWYMYFSNSNVCIIGKITTDFEPTAFFDDTDIISIKTTRSDKILRNRAVVWGSADKNNQNWVFADVTRSTPWDYGNDSRAAVLSNSSISSTAAAYSMAYRMLDEWAQLLFTKELVVHGPRQAVLGDIVYVESMLYEGIGVVTSIGTTVGAGGHTTTMILDEKCPRLFGIFAFGSRVYAGTWGDGVKRKPIKYSSAWQNYKVSLTDLFVKDLSCNSGVLSCVTENGSAFISKEYDGYWKPVTLSGVTISGVTTSGALKARACTQDKRTNNIRLLTDTSSEPNFFDDYARTTFSGGDAYVLDITPKNILVGVYPIVLSQLKNAPSGVLTASGVTGIDIDNDMFNDYVSVMVTGIQATIEGNETDGYDFGYRNTSQWVYEDTMITLYSEKDYNEAGQYDNISDTFYNVPVFTMDMIDDREVVYLDSTKLNRVKITRTLNEGTGLYEVEFGTNKEIFLDFLGEAFAITRTSSDIYNLYSWYNDEELNKIYIQKQEFDFSGSGSYFSSNVGEFYIGEGYETALTELKFIGKILYCLWIKVSDYDFGIALSTFGIVTETITNNEILAPEGDSEHRYLLDESLTTTQGWHLVESKDNHVEIVGMYVYNTWTDPGGPYTSVTAYLYRDGVSSELEHVDGNLHVHPSEWSGGQISNLHFCYYYPWDFGTAKYAKVTEDGIDVVTGTPPSTVNVKLFQAISANNELGKHGVEYVSATGKYYWITVDYTRGTEITLPGDYTIICIFPCLDDETGLLYVFAHHYTDEETLHVLLGINSSNEIIYEQEFPSGFAPYPGYPSTGINEVFNSGSFFIAWTTASSAVRIYYVNNDSIPTQETAVSLVMRRDGMEFTVVNVGLQPQRIDTSGSYPLVSCEENLNSLHLIDTGTAAVYPYPLLDASLVGDFRYTYSASGISQSGGSTYFQSLFVTTSGELKSADITDISKQPEFSSVPFPSGVVASGVSGVTFQAVEISNFISEEQYIFVATAGEDPHFYQQDKLPFREQSTNLGSFPVTIIRLDDRI